MEDMRLVFLVAIFDNFLDEIEQNIVICQYLADQLICEKTAQIKIFCDNRFNNCFMIRSPSLFSYFNHYLTVQGSDLSFFTRERGFNHAWAEYYLQQNTFRRYYA